MQSHDALLRRIRGTDRKPRVTPKKTSKPSKKVVKAPKKAELKSEPVIQKLEQPVIAPEPEPVPKVEEEKQQPVPEPVEDVEQEQNETNHAENKTPSPPHPKWVESARMGGSPRVKKSPTAQTKQVLEQQRRARAHYHRARKHNPFYA